MGAVQVKQHTLYPIVVPDRSTEHVSAFAAQRQAVSSTLSDATNPRYASALQVPEEGVGGSGVVKKRKNGSTFTVTKSKVQRIEGRKIRKPDQQPKTQPESSTGGPPPATTHQALQVTSHHRDTLCVQSSAEDQLVDIPATTHQNGKLECISQHPDHALGSENSLIETKPKPSQDEAVSNEAEYGV